MRILRNTGWRLRRSAEKARRLPRDRPDGWTVSPVDPGDVVKVFRTLKLMSGWKLCAYLFGEDGNGNGFVWAIPADQPVPPLEECERQEGHFLGPPRPPGALDDFMEAIEGNGTPQSYLSASILARELSEFGALWHGCSWTDVSILSGKANPDRRRTRRRAPDGSDGEDYWTWHEPAPEHFGPFFDRDTGVPRITLHLYHSMGGEGISEVMDTYGKEGYMSRTTGRDLAEGRMCRVY